eukprot:TRINITY_DN14347_c0_g1::TRINITY_DN14347_c0_g1_i1::g.22860::m.22860 TRINITY_DN14347_c0_g1::TRINITY_DN14347_c0_g1_i1::g.22860  ORF type:complete len:234 (-),score=37.78,sp/C3LSV6/NCPP_VIBCM/42.47/3e-36,NTPase_I-T/PF01931.13/6.3e-48 TRINITY_DN14347_c0_g1_i1:379-1014(-)
MKISIGSKNVAKIRAVEHAFQKIFPQEFTAGEFAFVGVHAESGVSSQPFGDRETLQGAINRAKHALELCQDAHYGVGLEGGVEWDSLAGSEGRQLQAFAWRVVMSRDGKVGHGRTGTFQFPPRVAELILDHGMELGHADDLVFGKTNSKEKEGAVGLLTGGVVDRAAYYEHALMLSLIPFKNAELFPVVGPQAVHIAPVLPEDEDETPAPQ